MVHWKWRNKRKKLDIISMLSHILLGKRRKYTFSHYLISNGLISTLTWPQVTENKALRYTLCMCRYWCPYKLLKASYWSLKHCSHEAIRYKYFWRYGHLTWSGYLTWEELRLICLGWVRKGYKKMGPKKAALRAAVFRYLWITKQCGHNDPPPPG